MSMKTVVSLPLAAAALQEAVSAEDVLDTSQPQPQPQPQPQIRMRSVFLPLLLCALALSLSLAWQAHLLLAERGALQAAHAGQQQTVDNAGKLRASLDALAADTQRLADTGNASAALLVAELRGRGVTINPQAVAAPAAPSRP